MLVRESYHNNRPKLASVFLESSYLPYSGHRNKRPPESIPRSFDKWARKLFTIPVRVLPNLKKSEKNTHTELFVWAGWTLSKAKAIDVSLDRHQWRFWQFQVKCLQIVSNQLLTASFFVSPQNCYFSVGPQLTRHQSSLLVVARGVYPFPYPSPPAPAARVTRRRLGRNQGPQRVRSIMVKLNFKHTALLEKDNGGSITCIVFAL